MSANAIETLRYLLENEPEAGRDHKRDMEWCVDCGEWIAEYGAAVETLLEAADTWAYERRRWIDGEAPDRAAMQDAEVALVHAVRAVRWVETGQ